ncbi:MAG: hypothetical protein GY743_22910 [Planctomycetaceae bacterium]|nr:hypothetical protein [Planctomycetaceae bacterium]
MNLHIACQTHKSRKRCNKYSLAATAQYFCHNIFHRDMLKISAGFPDAGYKAPFMKYESFDRIEIVHLQGELRARWVFGLPGYHKRN